MVDKWDPQHPGYNRIINEKGIEVIESFSNGKVRIYSDGEVVREYSKAGKLKTNRVKALAFAEGMIEQKENI